MLFLTCIALAVILVDSPYDSINRLITHQPVTCEKVGSIQHFFLVVVVFF